MQLVSNSGNLKLHAGNLEIAIASENHPPFHVAAIVEEQDAALLLGKDQRIHALDEKPAWYLSHKMTSQPLQLPGDVLLRYAMPIRLLAIVHDFDQDPSWNQEWVAHALVNIARLTEEKHISSLQLPVLGLQHGRIDLQEFVQLFALAFCNHAMTALQRIWLVVDDQHCNTVYSSLKARLGKNRQAE